MYLRWFDHTAVAAEPLANLQTSKAEGQHTHIRMLPSVKP